MRKLFCLFGLLVISLSASAASEWLFYKNFPWVYDNVSKDWLYLRGSSDGEVYAYRSSTKEWEVFEVAVIETVLSTSTGQIVIDKFGEDYRYRNIGDLISWTVFKSNFGEWIIQTHYHDNNRSWSTYGVFDNLPNNDLRESNYEINDQGDYIWISQYGLSYVYDIVSVSNDVVISNYRVPGGETIGQSYFFISKEIAVDFYNSKLSEDWEQKYEEWMQNPEPYGGLSVLQEIKDAKESGATELHLGHNNISDVTPVAELTNLKTLWLYDNNISDFTPLAGLTNLTGLALDNNIAASQKAMLVEALPNTHIQWSDVFIDDSVETEKTWDEKYEEWIQNPEPYGGLSVLQQIKDAKDSGYFYLDLASNNITDITPLAGLTNLWILELQYNIISDLTPLEGLTNLRKLYLGDNNISDLTPLAGLANLTWLRLSSNNITDITPLAGLTNLWVLNLADNNITDSQKTMLESALPNTSIIW